MLFLLFQMGPDRYALEAAHAVEIVPFLELKKVPQAPRGLAGIINYRGQPVPVLDLCELTLGRPAREQLSTRIIIVNPALGRREAASDSGAHREASPLTGARAGQLLGLIAEQATRVFRRDERDLLGVGPGQAAHLGPVIMDEQGVIQLMQTARLAGLMENAMRTCQAQPLLQASASPLGS